MQDEDGGVWPKQTTEEFADFVMPDLDKQVSYVIGTGQEPYKSSAATLTLRRSCRLQRECIVRLITGFARRCLAAAEKAWSWLQKYPNVGFKNPLRR
jgi:endoglucanase